MDTGYRIGIIGAGAVGGAFAAALHRHGFQVTVTARGKHLSAIRTQGITLEGVWGSVAAKVSAATALSTESGPYDLIMICTKAQDMDSAIEANRDALQNTCQLLLIQNGITGFDILSQRFPKHQIAQGLAGLATSMLEPGIIRVTNLATTYIGSNTHPAFAQKLVSLLSPAIPVEYSKNFRGALWTKLVVNCVNAFPAITNLSVQELSGTGLLEFMGKSMQEAIRVGLAEGIIFADLMNLSHHELVAFLDQDPNVLPDRLVEFMGPVPNLGSTLQSMRRGKAPEVDYLNGAIIEAAKKHNIATHVNEAIQKMVWSASSNGFYRPEEALQMLYTLTTSHPDDGRNEKGYV